MEKLNQQYFMVFWDVDFHTEYVYIYIYIYIYILISLSLKVSDKVKFYFISKYINEYIFLLNLKLSEVKRELSRCLDEKQEIATERDIYRNKCDRLNNELNYILSGDERKIVDIDTLITERNEVIERIDCFTYMGSYISCNGLVANVILAWIQNVHVLSSNLHHLWRRHEIRLLIKR
ncbi:unnamed protein product [Trichobilharzia regenti]|nr:unnamed protein product [Trichobilharzia regenti]